MGNTRTVTYILFLLALSVWVGGGIFDSISSHFAWHADPVAYVRGHTAARGTVNPWPYTTAFLALTTLLSMLVFARGQGPGKRQVLLANAATVVVLIATGAYFVPVLSKLSNHALLSDAQIVSLSVTWIRLNLVRQVFLVGLLTYALVGLMKLSAASRTSAN